MVCSWLYTGVYSMFYLWANGQMCCPFSALLFAYTFLPSRPINVQIFDTLITVVISRFHRFQTSIDWFNCIGLFDCQWSHLASRGPRWLLCNRHCSRGWDLISEINNDCYVDHGSPSKIIIFRLHLVFLFVHNFISYNLTHRTNQRNYCPRKL